MRTDDYGAVQGISPQLMNDQARARCTLRGLLELQAGRARSRSSEVEPVEAIVKRFVTGRHVLRLHQPGSARDPGHRHEPSGRQEQHRRGRRRPGALQPAANGD
ncbi:MAG: hypothetical protein MZU84_02225 [Sphingobacterium sp.]|nr:hypothetical protein [Sphingobacterium sp.]